MRASTEDGGGPAPGRLRWRCRRGMKELDLLLTRWLDQRWTAAGAGARADFARLLDCQDPELAAWLLRGQRPGDSGLAGIVDDILACRPRT